MKCLLTLLLFSFHVLSAKTIFVKKDATGLNNGTTWANAYPELKTALPTALYGDEIWVAQGEYRSLLPGDSSFVLRSGVRLLGGFGGWETEAAQRDWVAHVTILSGKGYAPNVIYCAGTDSSTLLDGFTVREGFALPLFGDNCEYFPDRHSCYGGGLYLYSGDPNIPTSLTVRNCRFVDSYAGSGGGIAANYWYGNGNLTVKNCYFSNSLPGDYQQGGGIYISIASSLDAGITIDSCLFENNQAYVAGAVAILSSGTKNMIVSNCTFRYNTGRYNCGAISNQLSANAACTIIKNCIFDGNVAMENAGTGAAILGRRLNISGCLFVNNVARTGGALNVGVAQIENSIFANNKALSSVGLISKAGVAQLNDTCTITNCLFLNNYTDRTGGVFKFVNHVKDTIKNCIFIGNRAAEGGDWATEVYADQRIYLDHCYIDAESCDALPYIHPAQDPGTVVCGAHMFYQDTDPMLLDTAAGQYGLQLCSPLINAGDSAWVQRLGILKDYAGLSRSMDGNVDIGAIEGNYPLTLLQSSISPTCAGQSTGGLTLELENACLPLEYEWWDGTHAGSGPSGLGSGDYAFTITDLRGRSLALAASIPVSMPVTLNTVIVNASSANTPNGEIVTNILNAIQPCQFLWSTGDSTSQIEGLLPGHYFLTVTDGMGCTYDYSFFVDFLSETTEVTTPQLHIFPNPATNKATFRLPEFTQGVWSLTDVSGKRVREGAWSGSSLQLEVDALSPGLYFFQLLEQRGRVITGKMALQQ